MQLSARVKFTNFGHLIEDTQLKASESGLIIGSKVVLKTSTKNLREGTGGTIVKFQDKYVVVSFQDEPDPITVPASSIELASEDDARNISIGSSSTGVAGKTVADACTHVTVKEEEKEDGEEDGEGEQDEEGVEPVEADNIIPYKPYSDEDAAFGLQCLAASMLWQAYVASAVDDTIISLKMTATSAPYQVCACTELKKSDVALVPWVGMLPTLTKPKLPAKKSQWRFLEGPDIVELVMETKGAKPMTFYITGQLGGELPAGLPKTVAPFWMVRKGAGTYCNMIEQKVSWSAGSMKSVVKTGGVKAIADGISGAKQPVLTFPIYIPSKKIDPDEELFVAR